MNKLKFLGKRKFLKEMRLKYNDNKMTFKEAVNRLEREAEPPILNPLNHEPNTS